MDVDAFFDWIRQNLIDLMNRELTDLGSARVQTMAWIRFTQSLEMTLESIGLKGHSIVG